MTKYTILPTWLTGLTPEQQKILLYAIVEYYEGRVVDVTSDIEINFHVAQFYINQTIEQQQHISEINRKNIQKRWQKNTTDTKHTNRINRIIDTTDTNRINTPDPQPLTPPDIPEPSLAPAPAHVNNPSFFMLQNNTSSTTINNINYNTTIEDANYISTYIDAYIGTAQKQKVADLICALLHDQEWLVRPLIPELTTYLLIVDDKFGSDIYSSVIKRLMDAFRLADKNIETLRLMLNQSIGGGWKRIIKLQDNGTSNTQFGSSAEQELQRRNSIIDQVYDHYDNLGQ